VLGAVERDGDVVDLEQGGVFPEQHRGSNTAHVRIVCGTPAENSATTDVQHRSASGEDALHSLCNNSKTASYAEIMLLI
jgi:hypothetical protein